MSLHYTDLRPFQSRRLSGRYLYPRHKRQTVGHIFHQTGRSMEFLGNLYGAMCGLPGWWRERKLRPTPPTADECGECLKRSLDWEEVEGG